MKHKNQKQNNKRLKTKTRNVPKNNAKQKFKQIFIKIKYENVNRTRLWNNIIS